MKSFSRAIIFGLGVWVIPFVVAMFIYPLRVNDRVLFESIMPVVLTFGTVLFAVLYFKRVELNFLKEGIYLGILWFLVNIGIDLLMFMWGPMQMTFVDYMKDIGLTYVLIVVITIGMGYLEQKSIKRTAKTESLQT